MPDVGAIAEVYWIHFPEHKNPEKEGYIGWNIAEGGNSPPTISKKSHPDVVKKNTEKRKGKLIHSKEEKEKRRKKMLGNDYGSKWERTDEWKVKHSQLLTGHKKSNTEKIGRYERTNEWKVNKSKTEQERWKNKTPEEKEKQTQGTKDFWETYRKIGKVKKQKTITCSCGQTGGISNMKRWHLNNCKDKK